MYSVRLSNRGSVHFNLRRYNGKNICSITSIGSYIAVLYALSTGRISSHYALVLVDVSRWSLSHLGWL